MFIITSRADDFVHGRQTYVFTYTLENVVRYFERHRLGRVLLGRQRHAVAPAVRARDRARDDAGRHRRGAHRGAGLLRRLPGLDRHVRDHGRTGGAVTAQSAGPVLPYQTMTIAIGFEPGTFTPFDSSYFASPWGWLQAVAGVGARRRRSSSPASPARGSLRDEPGRPTIIAEYTPPRVIDALESAVLLGLTTKAIPAEVLEQAVAGSIRIVEGERRMFGGVRLKAVLVDPSKADGDGRMLLDGLFPRRRAGRGVRVRPQRHPALVGGAEDPQGREPGARHARPAPGGARQRPSACRSSRRSRARRTRRSCSASRRSTPAWIRWSRCRSSSRPALVDFIVIAMVVAQAADRGRRRDARPPARAQGVHRVGRGRPHPHAAVAAGRRARADRQHDPAQILWLYELLLPYAVVFGQEKQWAKELAVLYGPGNSPGLVLRHARLQRRLVLVGHLDAVGEHVVVVVDVRRIERRRLAGRWRRRRRRRRGRLTATTARARVRAGRRGYRPALVPCTKSVLQSHAVVATAKQLPLNSITTR